jgi:hypothetical protein
VGFAIRRGTGGSGTATELSEEPFDQVGGSTPVPRGEGALRAREFIDLPVDVLASGAQ